MDYSAYIEFPCIRGIQGVHPQYMSIWSFGTILRLLGEHAKTEIDNPEGSFDRRVAEKIIRELINSQLCMHDISIVAAAFGDTEFREMANYPHCGILRIPVSLELKILHGLNLVGAIILAKLHPSMLIQQTIPVLIIPAQNSERFSTIQENLSRKALEIRHKMSASGVQKRILHEKVRDLLSLSLFLKVAVAIDKSSIAPRSRYLLTHSCLSMACSPMFSSFDKHNLTNEMELVAEYWQYLGQIIKPWREYFNGKISANNVRQKTILSGTAAVGALGKLGAQIITAEPASWKKKLIPLRELDWKRNASSIWEGVAVRNDVLLKGEKAKMLTYQILKQIVAV